jgi:hypothetical protein
MVNSCPAVFVVIAPGNRLSERQNPTYGIYNTYITPYMGHYTPTDSMYADPDQ